MNTTAHPPVTPPAHHRILVVDDNPSIHTDFLKILCPRQRPKDGFDQWEAILFDEVQEAKDTVRFELDSAHQGEEALEMVKQALAVNRPYALAFVDVRMPPGWDGIETVSRLWEVQPRLQVVICTAYSDYSWEEMRARLGRPDNLVVLKKPFDNVEVQQLAHALTRKWELNLQAELKMEQLEAMVRTRTAELEQANANLARSEERFAKAFHTSPVAMAIQSLPDRRVVDANERMIHLTGRRREELIGAGAGGVFNASAPPLVESWYASLARGEVVREQETELRDQAGNLHQVLVSLAPVVLADQPHALLAVRDVTERAQLEQQLRQVQKMEAVGQLAAGIAHDFNNILTIIQAHAELIASQITDDGPEARSLKEITRAANRATDLIRQLLAFSRKQVMQFRYLDLNEAIQGSLGMVRRLVGEHIRLHFSPAPRLPTIYADLTMLEQILLNLASNARDAMPKGGEIEISTSALTVQRGATPLDPEERHGEFVRLTFTDTGCGMDKTTLNRIFEPFFTTKGVGAGTGLGLSTVFGAVRQHGGWIEVDSHPGQGTTFQVHFPAGAQPVEKPPTPLEIPRLLRGRETILVAEDEDALREMVSLVLTRQGYSVLVATSGPEALTVYESAGCPIDLLLTDIVMPGGIMGGELARRLRAFNPELKVIFTSGYRPGMAGVDVSLVDGENFLPKPYSINKLAQIVRETLDRSVPVSAN